MTPKKIFPIKQDPSDQLIDDRKMIQYINLKLLALGSSVYESSSDSDFLELAKPLLLKCRFYSLSCLLKDIL